MDINNVSTVIPSIIQIEPRGLVSITSNPTLKFAPFGAPLSFTLCILDIFMNRYLLIYIFLAINALLVTTARSEESGTFVGHVVAEWLDDKEGRKMKLAEPFAFIEKSGERWDAPKGSIVDGASIPKIAWSIIGGPFEGKYRNASVIHDVACNDKDRTWQSVHKVFYDAMLASGVDISKAKIMYAAVYHFGPRWSVPIAETRLALTEIDEYKKSIKSRTKKSFDERVVVSTKSIPRKGPRCSPGVSCMFGGEVDLPPTYADVTVKLAPISSAVTEKDFQRLRLAIESKDLSLAQIEQFK